MAASELEPGQNFGNYKVTRELGRGGMGVVYRAEDLTLQRFVALKVLRTHLAEDPAFVQRFLREARAAARLNHPNIVQVYSVGELDSIYYIAMEYVRGAHLGQYIEAHGRLAPAQALRVGWKTAEALSEAHSHSIIHRDIKPMNVMVDHHDRVRVMDFGLAKVVRDTGRITSIGTKLGTPHYMAPEQVEGLEATPKTDLYALGVMLYELLVGSPPFKGSSNLSLMYKIANDPFPSPRKHNPEVSASLSEIILRLTARSPDDRYASSVEVATVLRDELNRVTGAPVLREDELPNSSTGGFEQMLAQQLSGFDFTPTPSQVLPEHGRAAPPPAGKPAWHFWALGGGLIGCLVLAAVLSVAVLVRENEPPPPPAPRNQALEMIAAGRPVLQAYAEAVSANTRNNSPKNGAVLRQVRNQLVEQIEGKLNAIPYDPADLQEAERLTSKAAAAGPDPTIEWLQERVKAEHEAYDIVLTQTQALEQFANFRVAGSRKVAAKAGDYVNGRFLIKEIRDDAVALEDTEISQGGQYRRLLAKKGEAFAAAPAPH